MTGQNGDRRKVAKKKKIPSQLKIGNTIMLEEKCGGIQNTK